MRQGTPKHAQHHQHEVGAHAELLALVAHHQRVEVGLALLHRALEHGEVVGAQRVHLAVDLDQAHPVAQVVVEKVRQLATGHSAARRPSKSAPRARAVSSMQRSARDVHPWQLAPTPRPVSPSKYS